MKASLIVLISMGAVSGALAQSVRVKIEDTKVNFELPPMMTNRVTMVPLRGIVDAMGGTMRWDLEKETVTIWTGNRRIEFVLNSRSASVNSKRMEMEEAPFMHKARIFVPLKFMAVAAGYVSSQEKGWYVLRPVGK